MVHYSGSSDYGLDIVYNPHIKINSQAADIALHQEIHCHMIAIGMYNRIQHIRADRSQAHMV